MSKFTHAAIMALMLSPIFAFASQGSGTGGDSYSSLESQGSGTGGDSISQPESQGSGTGGDAFTRLRSQGSGTGGDAYSSGGYLSSQGSGTGGDSSGSAGGNLDAYWAYSRFLIQQQVNKLNCVTTWSCLFSIEK